LMKSKNFFSRLLVVFAARRKEVS